MVSPMLELTIRRIAAIPIVHCIAFTKAAGPAGCDIGPGGKAFGEPGVRLTY